MKKDGQDVTNPTFEIVSTSATDTPYKIEGGKLLFDTTKTDKLPNASNGKYTFTVEIQAKDGTTNAGDPVTLTLTEEQLIKEIAAKTSTEITKNGKDLSKDDGAVKAADILGCFEVKDQFGKEVTDTTSADLLKKITFDIADGTTTGQVNDSSKDTGKTYDDVSVKAKNNSEYSFKVTLKVPVANSFGASEVKSTETELTVKNS